MSPRRAFETGVIAAVGLYALILLAGVAFGVSPDVQVMIGMTFGLPRTAMTWIVGFVLYLLYFGSTGVIYSVFSKYSRHSLGWRIVAASVQAIMLYGVVKTIPALQVPTPLTIEAVAAVLVVAHIAFALIADLVRRARA